MGVSSWYLQTATIARPGSLGHHNGTLPSVAKCLSAPSVGVSAYLKAKGLLLHFGRVINIKPAYIA